MASRVSPGEGGRRLPRAGEAAAGGALLALPLFAVNLPPSTDLPQLIAQVELLSQAAEPNLGGERQALRVQAWHPNKLGYAPILAGWMLAGDGLGAGRWAMLLVAASWTAALFAAARWRNRPPGSLALAALFFYSASWHWGFVNFLMGFPAFLLAWL
ncbi:MAG: hypothetical protein AAF725_18190 [Acidobacteriota bacterium]